MDFEHSVIGEFRNLMSVVTYVVSADPYTEGRNKGFAMILETLRDNFSRIMALKDDLGAMMRYFGDLIGLRRPHPDSAYALCEPEYCRGINESLKIGKIVFRMYAKQKIMAQTELSP